MKECDIPLSPNWFLSSASSGNLAGLYAFGGRQEVFVYDVSKASPETLPKLVCVYSGHRELISAVSLSPDPEQLICCSSDNRNVKLWDVRSLVTIQCHSEHTEQITCLTWSSKNTDIIFTASEKGNIILWRLKDNTVSSFQLERDCIISMKASPHAENTLLIGYKKGLAVIANFSREKPRIIQRLSNNDGEITSVCWCPRLGENFLKDDDDSNGALVATAGRRFVKVWGSLTGRQVLYKELQRSYSSEVPDFMSKKAWVDLHWPSSHPNTIVFTSTSGDLSVWNLLVKPSQKPQHFAHKKLTVHSKKIFNVVATGKNRLTSFSLDRVICVWDVDSLSAVCSMPSIGGHIFCARASPLDPGYVAIGSGANTISIWNQGSKYSTGEVTSLNYGTRSKITCVAWHPEKEGLLAFGSEDGRVGVCNVLTKRPPILSTTFHKKTVYVVCWGYSLKTDKDGERLTVYSVGDGNVLQHFISNDEKQREAVNVMKHLKEVNGDQIEEVAKSELSWCHDFTKFAIGSGSGVVEIYSFPDLRIVCSIQCQTKLVNCIRWHPQATEETSCASACRNWIALAGNDQFISVHDLSILDGNLDTGPGGQSNHAVLTQPLRMLKGHTKRVTDVCWSLHKDAHLVSVSFDSSAIVWNAKTAEALACYREHSDRLLTVLWSSLDPDLILTAGTDSLLRVWRLSDQPPVDLSTVEIKPKKKKVPSNPLSATSLAPDQGESRSEADVDSKELKELRDLLEMKKRQLLMQVDSLDSGELAGNDEASSSNSAVTCGATGVSPTSSPSSSHHNARHRGESDNLLHHHHRHHPHYQNNMSTNSAESGGGYNNDSKTKSTAAAHSSSSSTPSTTSIISATTSHQHQHHHRQRHHTEGEEEEEEEEEGEKLKTADDDDDDHHHHDGPSSSSSRGNGISISRNSTAMPTTNSHHRPQGIGATTTTTTTPTTDGRDGRGGSVKKGGRRGEAVVAGDLLIGDNQGADNDGGGDDDHDNDNGDGNNDDFDDFVGEKLVTVEDLVPSVKPFVPVKFKSQQPPSSSSSWSSARTRSTATSHHTEWQEGGAGTNSSSSSRKRKPKIKSFFPVLSKEANKGKASLQEDLLDLTAVITGQGDTSELVDKKPHLGLYTDRLGAHRCLLQESESHLSHENMEYHLQVELWRGNVAGALQIARQRNELSDWIIAMAPLASHELWEVVCVEYAEVLEEEGHYHKAASYLLAGHRVNQAIELFRNHRLYKEAVSLARIRLSPVDPILEDLYTEWGQSLMKDGQFEQAAKCTYLAMRQIQEASKMISRRNDQSSLRTACHINLMAKEEPAGTEYAFKLLSQHLVAGEWKEAYGFVKEHDSLKPFLPLLCTHELLVEQLHALSPAGSSVSLTHKPLDASSSFGQWGANDGSPSSKGRINLPDFLVNKMDTDLVVPWDPLLIEGHTFPHHVLRRWYYGLHMDLLPAELKSSFGVIAQLLEFQKSFADIPQSMVVLSTHLTLCFISLLLSETSTAISHLLQATAFLHQNERRGSLLALFCRLVLPQGPKYLLKLQQEFNASRLVISMESPGGGLEQAGGEGHSTIKKYLSDIKDIERGISSAGSRCRELDCVRSFYYLAVLEYLNEEFTRVGQHGEDDGIPLCKDDAEVTELMPKCVKADESSHIVNGEVSAGSSLPPKEIPTKNVVDKSSNPNSLPVDPSDHKSNLSTHPSFDASPNKEPVSTLPKTGDEQVKSDNDLKNPPPPLEPPTRPSSTPMSSSSSSSSPSSPSSSSLPTSIKGGKSKSAFSHHKSKLDQKNLLHLSKGILWDVQAKREALTETLGYIHRAISQHLLTNRSDSSQQVSTSSASYTTAHDSSTSKSALADEDGSCHSSRLLLLSASSSSTSSSCSLGISTTSASFISASPTSAVSSVLLTSSTSPTHGNALSTTHIPPMPLRPVSQDLSTGTGRKTPSIHRSISETVSSRKVGGENPAMPMMDGFEVRQKVEQELLGILPSSPTMASHKNRKVFWMDSKENSPSYTEDALVKRNPEGTQIPLEWDNLPVDLKYTQPYISQALLRQEQEIIAAELKQVPDGSKVPFPSLQRCTKTLLDACVNSIDLSAEEKQAYMKHLKDWSVLFAVTSYNQDRVEKEFSAAFQQYQEQ